MRVLILGDSISIAYTPHVREILGEHAVVVRPMLKDGARAENCAGTTKGVEHVDRWVGLEGGEFDVIHFNFGLHDLKRVHPKTGANSNDPTGPNQASFGRYIEQLELITRRLQETGARVIFATTTPVPTGGVKPHRDPADVSLYNEGAVRLMRELDVEVNDLYAFVLPRLAEMQRPINVHFTAEGSRQLGEAVSAQIVRCD